MTLRTVQSWLLVLTCACAAPGPCLAQALRADCTIAINEILYNPLGDERFEWIELHSQMTVDTDISGWTLDGGVSFEFPDGTVVEGGGYLVVAADPNALDDLGFPGAVGPFQRRLSNSGERIVLRDLNGRSISFVEYGDNDPWPVAPDGSGATLAKVDVNSASPDPANWSWSAQRFGTPGAPNFDTDDPHPLTIAFNEVAGANDENFFIELVNRADAPMDLAGVAIVDRDAAGRFELAAEELAAGAHRNVSVAELGFRPVPTSRLFLYATPEETSVLDAVVVADRLRGRNEDGRWLYPDTPTPGAPNRFALHDEIVINEILYHYRPIPFIPETPPRVETTTVVRFDGFWRYNQSGADLGSDWHRQSHAADNANWFIGRGTFGFEDSPLEFPIRTTLTDPFANDPFVVTHYFEAEFQSDGDEDLLLRHQIDDGAAFYLNGVEIHRFNMPEGPVQFDTLATERIVNAEVSESVSIARDFVVPGTNRLSVEVHQQNNPNRDVVFGAELQSIGQEISTLR